MSIPAWLRRSECPSAKPEPSLAPNEHSPFCRRAVSDRLALFSRHATAGAAGGVLHKLRRGLVAALLCLPLLAGLAPEAAAQTPTPNDDGSYTVPDDWALKPSGIAIGGKFRLLFVTSTTRDATSTNIADYNTVVQSRAAASKQRTICFGSPLPAPSFWHSPFWCLPRWPT